MIPICPRCESTIGFESTAFGDGYFVLVFCKVCGVVVGVVEFNAVWPAVEEVKEQIRGLDAHIGRLEALLPAR
jgi:hypothetical protein